MSALVCHLCRVAEGEPHTERCIYDGPAVLYEDIPIWTPAELAANAAVPKMACAQCGPTGGRQGWSPGHLDDEGRCPLCAVEAGRKGHLDDEGRCPLCAVEAGRKGTP